MTKCSFDIDCHQKLLQQMQCFTAQYIDDFEEHPFDFDTLHKHVERFVIVSAPLPTFIPDIRRIYGWEDPARTAKWMATFYFCWYISHTMTFTVSSETFGCIYLHTPGRFKISTTSTRFTSLIRHIVPHSSFHKCFTELVKMSKRPTRSSVLSPLVRVTTRVGKLELSFRAGSVGGAKGDDVVVLENMRGRDKAFNAVLGFGELRWQHLQRKPVKKTVIA
jgi:hypothetical protein